MDLRHWRAFQSGAPRPPRRRPQMQSSNPVFARADGFNGRGNASGMTYPGYNSTPSAPSAPQYGGTQGGYQSEYDTQQHGGGYGGPSTGVGAGRMTIDTVVQ